MSTNVTNGTIELIRIKKKHQIAFRRWINYRSPGIIISSFIGADRSTVREWISQRMIEGMTWNNYGSEWVIDHIVPFRFFDVKNEEDLKVCWHYKNLMPLFKRDNLNKESNVFFAFILLNKIKGTDFFYNKLYERILPEIDLMDKYISNYEKNYTIYNSLGTEDNNVINGG